MAGVDYWAVLRQSAGPFGATFEVMDLHDKDGKLLSSARTSQPGMAQNIPGMIGQLGVAGMNAFGPAAMVMGTH